MIFQSVSESKLFDHLRHVGKFQVRRKEEVGDQPSCHMYIFQVFIVLTSFDQQDPEVWVFS